MALKLRKNHLTKKICLLISTFMSSLLLFARAFFLLFKGSFSCRCNVLGGSCFCHVCRDTLGRNRCFIKIH